MAVNAFVLALLIYESIVDIRRLRINIIPAVMVGAFGLLMNVLVYKRPVWWMAGLAVGIVLLLAALISRERIGYGDGVIFLVLGVCVEPVSVLWILWLSMLAAGIVGCVGVIRGKRDRKSAVPYIPFVLAAYVAVFLLKMAGGLV